MNTAQFAVNLYIYWSLCHYCPLILRVYHFHFDGKQSYASFSGTRRGNQEDQVFQRQLLFLLSWQRNSSHQEPREECEVRVHCRCTARETTHRKSHQKLTRCNELSHFLLLTSGHFDNTNSLLLRLLTQTTSSISKGKTTTRNVSRKSQEREARTFLEQLEKEVLTLTYCPHRVVFFTPNALLALPSFTDEIVCLLTFLQMSFWSLKLSFQSISSVSMTSMYIKLIS